MIEYPGSEEDLKRFQEAMRKMRELGADMAAIGEKFRALTKEIRRSQERERLRCAAEGVRGPVENTTMLRLDGRDIARAVMEQRRDD